MHRSVLLGWGLCANLSCQSEPASTFALAIQDAAPVPALSADAGATPTETPTGERKAPAAATASRTPTVTTGTAADAPMEIAVQTVVPPLTGRVALFEVSVHGGAQGLKDVQAKLRDRSGTAYRWSPDGRRWRVLAPVPIEAQSGPAKLILKGHFDDDSPMMTTRFVDVSEAQYDRRAIRVSRRFSSPSKQDLRRADREAARMSRALRNGTPERLWRGAFLRPTATPETSPFGTLRTYNGKRKSRHLGIDLDGVVGDPIFAAQRGRAVLVEDRFYSGGTVVLDHGGGLFTLYFHMSAFDIEPGRLVEKGQRIGNVGKSGRVTGPHLHFSVKLDGTYVDPKSVWELPLGDDPLLSAEP